MGRAGVGCGVGNADRWMQADACVCGMRGILFGLSELCLRHSLEGEGEDGGCWGCGFGQGRG